MSKRTRLLGRLKHVYSHNTKLVLDVSNDDIGLIIEGVEKQIAKQPYTWGDGYYNGELIIDMYDCPNCERTYEIECDDYKYCPNCGQKLDWSEVE